MASKTNGATPGSLFKARTFMLISALATTSIKLVAKLLLDEHYSSNMLISCRGVCELVFFGFYMALSGHSLGKATLMIIFTSPLLHLIRGILIYIQMELLFTVLTALPLTLVVLVLALSYPIDFFLSTWIITDHIHRKSLQLIAVILIGYLIYVSPIFFAHPFYNSSFEHSSILLLVLGFVVNPCVSLLTMVMVEKGSNHVNMTFSTNLIYTIFAVIVSAIFTTKPNFMAIWELKPLGLIVLLSFLTLFARMMQE